MIVIETLTELREVRKTLPTPVGIVPTMGYLHDGHLSLLHKCQEQCTSNIVTLFVNPTQFNNPEDLAKYPRNLSQDLDLLQSAGADVVWTPSVQTLYPDGFQTWVDVTELTQLLEGAYRPGHFRGVTTIVTKLFNAVQPHRAYFGQKDAQQLAVIRQMVHDLNMPIEVVGCPIVREADGLAMSSRNSRLNAEERNAGTILFRALQATKNTFLAGERDAERLRQQVRQIIATEPLAQVEYVSCANPINLVELNGKVTKALLSLAVYVGEVRLIDNMLLGEQQQ